MLKRKYRLTKNKDFEKIVKKGKSYFSDEIVLKWIENGLPFSRFGIVVSLKVDKKATIRNKIKRRIRDILSKNLEMIKAGYDILILTRSEIKNLNYWQLKEKLENLFKKTKLLKNNYD
jgi:ribonuclease P protein component